MRRQDVGSEISELVFWSLGVWWLAVSKGLRMAWKAEIFSDVCRCKIVMSGLQKVRRQDVGRDAVRAGDGESAYGSLGA